MGPLGSMLAGLRRRPVRVRLAVVSAALTAVILIAFAAVVGQLVSDQLRDDFQDQVRETAARLSLSTDVATEDGVLVCRAVNPEEVALGQGSAIRVVDQYGQVLCSGGIGPESLGTPSPGSELRTIDNLLVADARIPLLELAGVGSIYVQYGRSRTSTDDTIKSLWLFLAGGVLIGTLLAGVAGMTIANRAMRPIAALTGTARTIARTRDPSLRIPEPENEDEVAELARTLDEMLRELDAARSETEHTIKRQREFVADASHELRTPLTSILANLELLDEALLAEGGNEDELAATRSALRSSKRMSRLVADLLILARADAGRRGERQPCDLAAIASEAAEEVSSIADEHHLVTDLPGPAPIEGEPDELHRMILNLLENSIRHTPQGTRIDVRLRAEGGDAVLEVADDGPGLPEGMEQQIFGRFVRGAGPADRSGSDEGTGLGLAIVKAVAVAHGGSVEAGASEAGGARFVIRIPLDPDTGDAEPEAPEKFEETRSRP
jgi:two-component system OmpR family sensor kinase